MKMSNITNRKYFVELVHIFEKNFQESYIDGYVINQKVNEEVDKSAIWWIQAESLSALKNINEIYPKEEYYLAIMSITEFIARNFMNPKKEWNWGIDENGIIQQEHSICEMWKANYHNVRAVLKILEESDGE